MVTTDKPDDFRCIICNTIMTRIPCPHTEVFDLLELQKQLEQREYELFLEQEQGRLDSEADEYYHSGEAYKSYPRYDPCDMWQSNEPYPYFFD